MAEKFQAFAQRLRTAREQLGLSQYALAKRTGLSKQTLSKLETGRHDPSWSTVQLLALALGVSCTEFIDPALQLPPGSEAEPRPRGRPRTVNATRAETQASPKGRDKASGAKRGGRKARQEG